MDDGERPDPRLSDVLLLCLGVGGLVLSITLVFLAMRAVMDIGGSCAEGGPYVPARSCPDGATPALLLGIFGGFAFGALGAASGARVGGYGWVPLLGWTGLFASLGWNFLDYGLFNPPDGEGIIWAWLIPGVMFQVMAWVPVWFAVVAVRDARRATGGSRAATIGATVLRGPGQPARRPLPDATAHRPPPVPDAHRVEVVGPVRRDALEDIDALMGALIIDAASDAPVDPDARAAAVTIAPAGPAPEATSGAVADSGGGDTFPESTQALLDRLERLADMRDRGLLTPDEYETAKESVMRELEARA